MIHLSLFMMLCLGVRTSSSEILQRQKRNWIIDSFSINESYTGPFPYSLGVIQVEKKFTYFEIHGQGVEKDPKGILKINENTGELTVHGSVDYEEYKFLKLKFQAYNREDSSIDTQLGIEIVVVDSNDNAPKFAFEVYRVTIKESTVQGTEVITVSAVDEDSHGKDGMFSFQIASVSSAAQDLEFFLTQSGAGTAAISFKGCLDHEKAETYTIIVAAIDQGEPPLSSSCTVIVNIEDGNNHIPVITAQNGPGKVKEGEENVLITRLQVKDEDTKGTGAWRVKYGIEGDTNNNFRITTDPETNEGLLYVAKNLDYEDSPQKDLTITVENEIAYHSCKVVKHTASGLWEVSIIGGGGVATGTGVAITGGGVTGIGLQALGRSTYKVTFIVEDVNEAPIFDKPNIRVSIKENTKPGQYLVTLKAKDPDINGANTFVYIKGHDPANWVIVDPKTGKITTSLTIDRESHYVKNNFYMVTIYAVDNGKPPMTATSTLSIHVTDENDNIPFLVTRTIDICQSDGVSLANITAMDLDEDPYSGPFHFKLLGDVEGKWRFDTHHGYSVNLVKENTVHSGEYELLMEVSDRQQVTAVQNVSVTVCDCFNTARPNCRSSRLTSSAAGGGTIGIILLSILLLAVVALLALFLTCKKPIIKLPDEGTGRLMDFNTEKPGNDCKVVGPTQEIKGKIPPPVPPPKIGNIVNITSPQVPSEGNINIGDDHRTKYLLWLKAQEEYLRKMEMEQKFSRRDLLRWSMGGSSTMRARYQDKNSMYRYWMKGINSSTDYEISLHRQILLKVITQMLYSFQTTGEELSEDILHVYAEEGEEDASFELDAISIPEMSFDTDTDLDMKFTTLASICMNSESFAYSTKTSYVRETSETGTLGYGIIRHFSHNLSADSQHQSLMSETELMSEKMC